MSAYSLSKLVQMHMFLIAVDSFAETETTSAPVAIAVSPGKFPTHQTQGTPCLNHSDPQGLFLKQAWFESTHGGLASR